jgi:catechol 2,3-dioxygenase-like lactoylglutathione lyase family enzyme
MLDHVTINVSDVERSKEFYEKALAPLGYKLLIKKQKSACFGEIDEIGKRDFWIKEKQVTENKSLSCLAFTASSKEEVNAFYKVALTAGGRDNGAPGPRPEYTENYYTAFVFDPDGHNIEAVFDEPRQS